MRSAQDVVVRTGDLPNDGPEGIFSSVRDWHISVSALCSEEELDRAGRLGVLEGKRGNEAWHGVHWEVFSVGVCRSCSLCDSVGRVSYIRAHDSIGQSVRLIPDVRHAAREAVHLTL